MQKYKSQAQLKSPMIIVLIIVFNFLVRNSQEEYVGTLDDGETGLIMSLACCQDSRNNVIMVTGGSDLVLWSQTERLG